jgi:hypothetical protein
MGRPELVCHYCGTRADRVRDLTRDHVVPVALLSRLTARQLAVFYDALPDHQPRSVVLVRACQPCNNAKGHQRSTCYCWVCREVWERYEYAVGYQVPATWVLPRRARSTVTTHTPLTAGQRRRLARRLASGPG